MTPDDTLREADQAIQATERLLWNVGDFARKVGVDRKTVRRWIRARKLAAVRLPNGYFRIAASEYDRFLSQK